MTKKHLKLNDLSGNDGNQLIEMNIDELVPLPPPYDKSAELPGWKTVGAEQKSRLVCNLDGFVAVGLPKLQNEDEEKICIGQFVSGMKKLLTRENNWTFLQPLLLSLEHCAQCQTCSDSCHVYVASGKNDLYRPTYRAEIFRRLLARYAKPGGKLLTKIRVAGVELNWTTISRLYELSYRCNLCRRCAQACPMGVDNALITREIRKLFSQELGWAPKELHEKGTVLQLEVGSPTGMRPNVAKDNVQFLDEDFTETNGFKISTPWDIKGADVLYIPGAGDILTYPESLKAFGILCQACGINWTLSSEVGGYDAVNYGLFYDDIQFSKIATRHAQIAKRLGVKKIILGECGHAHKALIAVADRILPGDLNTPRESIINFLENLVFSGKIKFDPSKNNFPITLHDPCNIVRNLGIIKPQRRILSYLCPQFREMNPSEADNYCCGGGGGLGLISQTNFKDWRMNIAGRLKFRQILETFREQPNPATRKYICAPCLNCKLQIRDLLEYFGAREKSGIYCGGLAELIVNAMTDMPTSFISWGEIQGGQ